MDINDFKALQMSFCTKVFENPLDRLPNRSSLEETINYKPGPSRRRNNTINTNFTNIQNVSNNSTVNEFQSENILLSQLTTLSAEDIGKLLQKAIAKNMQKKEAKVDEAKMDGAPMGEATVSKLEQQNLIIPEVSKQTKRKLLVSTKKKTVGKKIKKNRQAKTDAPLNDSYDVSPAENPKNAFELYKAKEFSEKKEEKVRRSCRKKLRSIECHIEVIHPTFDEIKSQEEFLYFLNLRKIIKEANVEGPNMLLPEIPEEEDADIHKMDEKLKCSNEI